MPSVKLLTITETMIGMSQRRISPAFHGESSLNVYVQQAQTICSSSIFMTDKINVVIAQTVVATKQTVNKNGR